MRDLEAGTGGGVRHGRRFRASGLIVQGCSHSRVGQLGGVGVILRQGDVGVGGGLSDVSDVVVLGNGSVGRVHGVGNLEVRRRGGSGGGQWWLLRMRR